MSLRINHNLAALNAHRNLIGTTNALSNSMQKLSSGYRINKGSDDPAGLVISEQFRAQIAGLNRAIDNSEGSINMIQTTEGALNEINSLLVSMRELAIHAANEGFNDASQLAADQAEISNAIKTIDRISSQTQFGTKKLLDGSKDNIATITTSNSSMLNVKQSYLTSGQHSVTATRTAESTAALNTTSLGLSLANTDGDPYNLAERIHTMDILQASGVAKKVSDNVSFTDAFGNTMTIAATADVAQMVSAAAVATATTSNVGTYTLVVNYQENGESPSGNQTIQFSIASGDTVANVLSAINDKINQNSELSGKVVAATSGTSFAIETVNAGAQYSLEVSSFSSNATTAWASITAGDDRGVSENTMNFTVNTVANNNTSATITLTAGTYASLSTLVTEINTQLAAEFGDVDGVTGTSDIVASVVDTNNLQFATRDEGSTYSLKTNAGTSGTGNLRNALGLTEDTLSNSGTDGLVSFDGYTSEISAVKYGSTGSVTIYNKADGEAGRGSMSMTIATAQNGLNIGNLLLDVKAARFDVRLDGGPAYSVIAGEDAVVFNNDRSESAKISYDLTSLGGSETINNIDQSLVFQIGANVGQTARISVKGMSASAMGKNIAGNMFRSLAEIDVTTVQGSQDAQSIVDAAINEVSELRGTLGSFQKNTLESNLKNLRIASQNLTASESRIRDTDMAAEMSEFTKNQILLQAGTAMLAQANQVPQVILSLFQ
jgi:flagellin